MARTPAGLADGLLLAGSNTIFTVPTGDAVTITSLILTNLDSDIKACEIYLNRGTSRLVTIVNIPSGNGKAVRVNILTNTNLDEADIITITADKTNINFDLSGYVISS